jgi:two-component system phosphate regulon response regulator OmpR
MLTNAYADRAHILVVDDDDRIRSLLARYLTDQDMVVMTAGSANEAREVMRAFSFDLLILDIMMPGETGITFLNDLRRTQPIPVIMLTALGEADNRVEGLEAGADDYIGKPFDPRELLLRIKAVLKRQAPTVTPTRDGSRTVGHWRFDTRRAELQHEGEIIKLTPVENNLLQVLTAQAGKILSREDLARLCQLEGQERAIDVQVTRLRRKIEENPALPRLLQTIRGKGYILHADPAA